MVTFSMILMQFAKPRQLTKGQTIWNVRGNSLAICICNNNPESVAVRVPADTKNEQIQLINTSPLHTDL
jgi:hypothetical protein